MKVLFVGSHLDKGGGQAFQTLRLFEELRHWVEGEYLCLRAGGAHTELLARDGVRAVGALRMPGGILDLRSAIRSERRNWDIVQVFDVYFGLPAAYLARAYPRTVLFGMDPITEISWRYGATARTVARVGLETLMRDTTLVVNSPALAETFRRYAPTFIPNGLDLARLDALPSREEARRSLRLAADAAVVLWVGKVVYSKRIEWLFEALRAVPNALLLAVGGYNEEHFGDRYLREVQSRYPDLGDHVRFTGEVPYRDVGAYLASADVFAFPSRFEGMPNAVMEAMAAGLPVVASDIPAHRTLIRSGETGLLAGTAPEFAESVSRLMADPGMRDRIGRRAREAVRSRYSFPQIVQRHLELYRELMDRA